MLEPEVPGAEQNQVSRLEVNLAAMLACLLFLHGLSMPQVHFSPVNGVFHLGCIFPGCWNSQFRLQRNGS